MVTSHIFLNVILGSSLAIVIACGAYLFSQKVKSLPFPVLLVFIGVVLSPLELEPLEAIRITPELVLFIFLPILLFESAFHFEFREFRRVINPAFFLATVGILISTTIMGLVLHLATGMHVTDALLYGSIISSTDPIAVLTVFKKLGVPKRLHLLIDGESMLNDATSVILYRIFLGLTATGTVGLTGNELAGSFGEFLIVLFGGVVIGAIVGVLFANLIAFVDNVSAVEIALTIVLSHLVFILAEHYFHVSGILAVLTAGLAMGNYGRTKISPSVLDNMKEIWEFLGFLATSLVFLLIGYEASLRGFIDNAEAVVIMIVAGLIARVISTYPLEFIYNGMIRSEHRKISFAWMHIVNWGALRGVLPLVIILSLPESYEHRELFINLVLGAIYFSLVVNGITMGWLLKGLKIDKPNIANLIEIKVTELLVLQSLLRNLDTLLAHEEISYKTYEKHKQGIKEQLATVQKVIDQWLNDKGSRKFSEEMIKVIKRYCLQIEKSVYRELFGKGAINEHVYNNLRYIIDNQADYINEDLPQFTQEEADLHLQVFKRVKGRDKLWMQLQSILGLGKESIVRDSFMYHKARFLGNEKVLEELEHFADEGLPFFDQKELAAIKKTYQNLMNKNRGIILSIQSVHGNVCDDLEEKLYRCESHTLMGKILKKFGEEDRISSKALSNLSLSV